MSQRAPFRAAVCAFTCLAVLVSGTTVVRAQVKPLRHTSTAMPCPVDIEPSSLVVAWKTTTIIQPPGNGPPRPGTFGLRKRSGKRIYRDSRTIAPLYDAICRLKLVRYNRPVFASCGAIASWGTFYLGFWRAGRAVLRLVEVLSGCFWLHVEGRPRLGNVFLKHGLLLPPGIPQPV